MSTNFAAATAVGGDGYPGRSRIWSDPGEECGQDECIKQRLRDVFAPVWICTEHWYRGRDDFYFGNSKVHAAGKPYI